MDPQGRIAVLVPQADSYWVSCRVIVRNLVKAYRILGCTDEQFFYYDEEGSTENLNWIATQIFETPPQQIVFVGHVPHPQKMLIALARQYRNLPMPTINFHVYGDFSIRLNKWIALEPLMTGMKIRWIGASERQVELIRKCIKGDGSSVLRCPFPVDTEFYCWDPALRRSTRQRLGFSKSDFVVIYTGRISPQKNTHSLCQLVARVAEKKGKKLNLILSGAFHDQEFQMFYKKSDIGGTFLCWDRWLRQQPQKISDSIQYVGHCSDRRLKELYNAADLFASLSLYHDEDFGMSPAEARATGLPLLLTDWGGYHDFFDFSKTVHLVSTFQSQAGLFWNDAEATLFLEHERHSIPEWNQRQVDSKQFQEKFSLSSVAKQLMNVYKSEPSPFLGFSRLAYRHQHRGAKALRDESVVFLNHTKIESDYLKLYAGYATKAVRQNVRLPSRKSWQPFFTDFGKKCLEKTKRTGLFPPVDQACVMPMPQIYLYGHKKLNDLNDECHWIIRDGKELLKIFFSVFPVPPTFLRTKLYVAEDLIHFVPLAWRKHFKSYHIVEFRLHAEKEVKKLLLFCVQLEGVITLSGFSEHLQRAKEQLLRKFTPQILSQMPVEIFIASVDKGVSGSVYSAEFVMLLSKYFGSNAKILSWGDLMTRLSYEGIAIYDVNMLSISSVIGPIHLALGRGASLISSEENLTRKIRGKYFKLSPYHGIQIKA